MNKALFFTGLLLLTVSSFAKDIENKYLFIEGTADSAESHGLLMRNFVMEANGAGYIVTSCRNEAAHTLIFNVASNTASDSYQYVVTMSLIRNRDRSELISFDYLFSNIDDMHQYARTLFLDATANIPVVSGGATLAQGPNSQWKNKWIYFRASFDYPFTIYALQETGLKGGTGLYNTIPPRVAPIDHEVMAMPGATLGAEFQLLNFLSLELNFQFSMGDTRNNYFVNLAGGFELKFPIKFQDIMLVPYGALSFPFTVSPIFSEFPPLAAGAGIQFCARAGKSGAFFVDVNYMFSFTDAIMHNPYLDFPAGQQLYPEPAVIHYKRSQIGLGLGYKIGILDR